MTFNTQNKISGLVITYNEEKNIEEVIHNLDFVDEIIVVDSYSTDRTIKIIEKYPHVKLVKNIFENFTAQRNLALDLASNPWILFIDADERVTESLKEEIIQTVNDPYADDAYSFYRKFMFQNKPLYFSGWQTDKNTRLFKKGKAQYIIDKLVHEKLAISGSQGRLKNKLIHYTYNDYESYKAKMVNYGKLKAKELYLKKIKPNVFHFYVKPTYKFLHSYLVRLGILDGKKGIIICYLNALTIYVRYPELKKLYKK